MDKIKNRFLSLIAIVFAFSLAMVVFAGFAGSEKKVSAADEVVITHGNGYTLNVAEDSYDYVTFEYKITNGTDKQISLVIMKSGWGYGTGYYAFISSGERYTFDGISTYKGEDDYIHVTISLADVTKAFGSGIPDVYSVFFVNGPNTTADGYIRNIEFGKYPSLEMVEGASVRLTDPYGIRFRANVPAELAAAEGVSYGMTIIPYDWVVNYSEYVDAANGDYIAALDGAGVTYRKFVCELNENNGDYYIQASLTNIKEKNLEREFIGIAWYEKDGVKHYAFNENCARSIREVAKKAVLAGGDYSETQEKFLLDTAVHYEYTEGALQTQTSDKAYVGQDVIEFYYKRKTDGGRIRFAVIKSDDWSGFYGYFVIDANNTPSHSGVSVTAENNGWYKVVLDPVNMTKKVGTSDPSDFAWFDTVNFYDETPSEAAAYDIMGLGVSERPLHPAPEVFTATNGLTKSFTSGAYSTVSFDYKITTGADTYFSLAILESGWKRGTGYYQFNSTGLVYTNPGISTSIDAEGYVHVTISLNDVTKAFGSGIPDTYATFYIRGDWSTAGVCYLDNLIIE